MPAKVDMKHVSADTVFGWPAYMVIWTKPGEDSLSARIFEYTEDVDKDLMYERAVGFVMGLKEILG